MSTTIPSQSPPEAAVAFDQRNLARTPLEGWVMRLMAIAMLALPLREIRRELGGSTGPGRPGLVAIRIPWSANDRPTGPRAEIEVPVLCPIELRPPQPLGSREAPSVRRTTPVADLDGVAVRPDGTMHMGVPRMRIEPDERGAWWPCTYPMPDGTFLIVSTGGRHMLLDHSLTKRLDSYSDLERVAFRVAEAPGSFALMGAIYALGTFFIWRRRKVGWLTFAGLLLTASWTWPMPAGLFIGL